MVNNCVGNNSKLVSLYLSFSRCGRAARESSGICYRLYTKEEQDKFAEFAKPEIVRSSLESILLQLSALNVKNFNKFDFIDSPSAENIKRSAAVLERLNAIKKLNDNEFEVIFVRMILFLDAV